VSAECVCACGDDYDMPEVYRESFHIARKTHICCECDGEIKPGEKYHRAEGVWAGEWQTYKTCLPCHRIREDFCKDGWGFGELQDVIWECLGFNYVTREEVEEDAD
jgi:hypothetical protein